MISTTYSQIVHKNSNLCTLINTYTHVYTHIGMIENEREMIKEM